MADEGLSLLDVQILRVLPNIKTVEELDKIMKVPPATLGREIARLQLGGYIGEDGKITEKGLDAIRSQ